MKINKEGIDLIKSFEGCVLHTYDDGFGNLTIGWGHCSSDVYKGQVLTQKEADDLLLKDVERFEDNVNKYVNTYKFNQNEYNALVSFAYNLGSVDELLKYGNLKKEDICDRMLLYCHANGEVVEGLEKRRKEEVKMFKKPCTPKVDMAYCYELLARTLLGDFGTGDVRKEKLGSMYGVVQEAINTVTDYFKKNI